MNQSKVIRFVYDTFGDNVELARETIKSFMSESEKDIGDVFVSLEEDGSQWVQLEDYNNLKKTLLHYRSERTKSFLLFWLDGDEKKADEIMATNGWVEMTSERLTEVLREFVNH